MSMKVPVVSARAGAGAQQEPSGLQIFDSRDACEKSVVLKALCDSACKSIEPLT